MLSTSIVDVTTLTAKDRQTMFQLYHCYYDGGDSSVFYRDLDAKDYAVVLRDADGSIRGFSTLAVYSEKCDGKSVRVLYSGDTIIERAYWGQNQFSKAWLELAGDLKAEAPHIPLYWLLIVKGHRTYRYLSLFSNEYFPCYKADTPPEIQQLMDHLATQKFGQSYDASSGLVQFPEPRSYMNRELAAIPDKDSGRPEVQYFLTRNPLYHQGDELLCLCELKAENLTKFARQWFEAGCKQKAS